jgi:hypothetical protein
MDSVLQPRVAALAVQAQVHDRGAALDRVVDRPRLTRVVGEPVRAEDAQRQDPAPPTGAGRAQAVVPAGSSDARDGGSVTYRVGGVRVVVHEVVARLDSAREIRVRGLHPTVDDGDHDLGRARRHLPGRGEVDGRVDPAPGQGIRGHARTCARHHQAEREYRRSEPPGQHWIEYGKAYYRPVVEKCW